MAMGLRNSSRSISPAVGSGSFCVMVLMVIYDFHVFDTVVCPNETNAVFVIDADGVLALAAALERFQPIARRNPEIVEFFCDVELLEFAQGYFLDVGGQFRCFIALMDSFGSFAAEGKN